MPFRKVGTGEFRTYFIGYARDPGVIEEMLRTMFLGKPAGNYDRILDFSRPVTGNLFYVPVAEFLDAPPGMGGRSADGVKSLTPKKGFGEVGLPLVAPEGAHRARAPLLLAFHPSAGADRRLAERVFTAALAARRKSDSFAPFVARPRVGSRRPALLMRDPSAHEAHPIGGTAAEKTRKQNEAPGIVHAGGASFFVPRVIRGRGACVVESTGRRYVLRDLR
jgi:hypothetical protein